jgi:hypothetical protein
MVLAGLMGFALLLSGCGDLMPWHENSSQLEAVRYDYVFSLEVLERHMTISPEGAVEVWQQTSNDPKDLKTARGEITPEQRARLISVFRDWHKLKAQYEVYIRGPVIYITYGDWRVLAAGGESTPETFKRAQELLDSIAASVLNGTATRPAGAILP